MYNNQRHIMSRLKNKAYEDKPNHSEKQLGCFYQSQQTTCEESFTGLQVNDDSEDQIEEIPESQQESQDERPFMKETFHFVLQKQITKDRFLSVSKLYRNQILSKYQPNPHDSTQHNYLLKCHQTNLKHQKTKLSIIKQLLQPTNHNRFQQIKQLITSSPISHDKIDQMQITLFKCECQFITISQRSFKKHLKLKSHKAYLWIQTKKERRNQQKFYKRMLLADNGQLGLYFNPYWLYKSFQVIFIQAGVHWQLVSVKKSILVELNKLKIQSDKLMNQLDSIGNYDDDLKKKWKKIYIKLHKLHNGNQRIYHKCMDIDQHLHLFALAILQVIKKNHLIFDKKAQQDKAKYEVFTKLIRITLMGFLDQSFQQQVNTKSTIPKLLEYHSIRMMLLKLLRNYIQTFDYIDLNDLYITFDRQT